MIHYIDHPSPLGSLRLACDDAALRVLEFLDQPNLAPADWLSRNHPILDRALRQLDDYFGGARQAFDLPLEPCGTEFQRRVWQTLLQIPYGVTTSYADIARRLGAASAMRAVGAANGRNPIAIIIPCHRVIGADGSLTGYGGGLPRKQRLLQLEGSLLV